MSRVTVEIAEHIATVILSRPDKMNASDTAMIEAVIDAGEQVKRDDVRAVVLTGAGRCFSAGLDVMSFGTLATGDPEALIMPRSHGDANRFQQVAMVWHDLPVPVIAALHGVCFGAGLQCALGADIRIAAPDTRLSIMEMKWGLVPDMGGMVILPRLLRQDVLRRLVYTHAEIPADEAQRLGLITGIAPDPLASAHALARDIAGQSPAAIRAAKRLTERAYTDDRAAVLHAESREQTDLIGKPDMLAAVARNLRG